MKYKLGLVGGFIFMFALYIFPRDVQAVMPVNSLSTTTVSGVGLRIMPTSDASQDLYTVRLKIQNKNDADSAVSGGKGSLGYAEIPASVLRFTTFSDIRLVDENADEVPYFLKRGDELSGALEEKFLKGDVSNLVVKNGKTEFVVDLGGEVLTHSKLDIETKSENFTRTVTLYGSDKKISLDSTEWGMIADNRYIYSYDDAKAGVYASSKTVQYNPVSFRYIKIVINRDKKQPQESVSVSGVNVTLKGVDSERTVLSSIQDVTNIVRSRVIEIKQNTSKKTTEVYTDLGSDGVAVNGVMLKVDRNNFTRKVVIQGSLSIGTTSTWTTLTSGDIHKINAPLYQGSKLNLSFHPKRYRYIRVIIQNNDNAPIDITGVDVVTKPDYIIFNNSNAVKNPSYVDMYFGSQTIAPPTYDLGGELLYGTKDQFKLFVAEKVEKNPFYNPTQPTIPWTEKNKWAINTALVVLALIIGAFVFVYIRKITPAQNQ